MKSYSHTYSGNPLYDYMEEQARLFGSPIENDTIHIPVSIGNGFIKNFFIEDGFCVRYFYFTLNKDFLFTWLNEFRSNEAIFKLMFYLEAPGVRGATNSTILYSTNFTRSGIVPKGCQVNRMAFMFTKAWLEENFIEASEKIFNIVLTLTKKNRPTLITEEMDGEHYTFANELANELGQKFPPPIHIKTRSLVLLNDFLNKIVSRESGDLTSNQTLYYGKIAKVENRIKECLFESLPNITALAIEFNMSPSTLKRHFKMVYGKNIYTYYLEKKLAMGKTMIESKTRSISEIAYTLGYNKINSFSKAFKKQYGVLPKEVNNSPEP
jgi:AraC-like DNA-binding protein